MPKCIELTNGDYLPLLCFEDAMEAVEDIGGWELRDFIEEYLQDNADDVATEKIEAEEAEKDQETSERCERRYRKILLMALDGLETLLEKLNESSPDREDMKNLITVLCESITNEL